MHICNIGTGFSTNACENSVLIGTYSCPITSSSATQIVCKIGSNSGLVAGITYGIEVQIKNSGNALQSNVFTFNFIPLVTAVSPSTGLWFLFTTFLLFYLRFNFFLILKIGSSSGGTTVLITGDGFTDSTFVQLSGVAYSKANSIIAYGQISLITSSSASGATTIKIFVNGVQATCNAICTFTFSSQIAPTITSVSPTSVSDATTLTITGTQFGTDPAKLTVKIGIQSCTVLTATSSQLTCSIPGLSLGAQIISVNLAGKI